MRFHPIPQTPTRVYLAAMPDGPSGTRATLRLMAQVAREALGRPMWRELAMDIVRPVAPKDWLGEAQSVYDWVRRNIRYVRDIEGIETVALPENTLRYWQGDCDDQSILVAVLAKSIGFRVRYVAVGFADGQYIHVYPEIEIGGVWYPADTTEDYGFGHFPDTPLRMVEPV